MPATRSELHIDKYDLDREVCEQSSHLIEMGLKAARLASVRDESKDHLKVITAERSIAIREGHSDDARKPTESQIDAWLMVDSTRQDAMRTYLDAERAVAEAEARRDAWKERGYMLKVLAELYAAGYWANASMNGPQRQVAEQQGNEARQAVSQVRRQLRRRDNES